MLWCSDCLLDGCLYVMGGYVIYGVFFLVARCLLAGVLLVVVMWLLSVIASMFWVVRRWLLCC